jgi:hypothetical protein
VLEYVGRCSFEHKYIKSALIVGYIKERPLVEASEPGKPPGQVFPYD